MTLECPTCGYTTSRRQSYGQHSCKRQSELQAIEAARRARQLAADLERARQISIGKSGYSITYTARSGWRILLDDDPELDAPMADDDHLAEILHPAFGVSA